MSQSSAPSCVSCFSKKAGLECTVCHEAVCKHCAQFISEDEFPFEPNLSPDLKLGAYCSACFSGSAASARAKYAENIAKAGEILVFTKSQRKETHWIRRDEEFVEVKDCADYDELVLRLGYLAAKLDYNAIIDVDIKSEKIRTNGYQRSRWHGRGIPAHVDPKKLVQDRSLTQNPN